MNFESFLVTARAYHDLGWAVIEQLQAMYDGDPVEDQNLNAVKMIKEFLEFIAMNGVEGTDYILDQIKEAQFDE